MGSAHLPMNYLIASSSTSLESFELSRLNAVANFRKELRQIVDDWVQAEVEARIAHWVLEHRRSNTRDPQWNIPARLKCHSTYGNATLALQATEECYVSPQRPPVSALFEGTSLFVGPHKVEPKSVLPEPPLSRGVEDAGHQQSWTVELRSRAFLFSETQTCAEVLRHERAARALRSYGGYALGRSKLPRRKLRGGPIHRIALLNASPAKSPLAPFAEPRPPEMPAQQTFLTDCDSHATSASAVPGPTTRGAAAGPGGKVVARKSDPRRRHSELWTPSAQRPPLPRLYRPRTAKGS